jgi:anaerobic selenocysteine-containing dehydrogenase
MICWTLGITEHHNAVDNVLALINLALLTGTSGATGAGLNPLRGQNNVQGGGDMGALPTSCPASRTSRGRRGARGRFERLGRAPSPRRRAGTSPRCSRRWSRGELRALYVIGENPARARPTEPRGRCSRASTPGRAGHLPDEDRRDGRRRAARVRGLRETDGTVTNSERRVQRVRKAVAPPAERAGRPLDHRGARRAPRPRPGPSVTSRGGCGTSCGRCRPMHRGMSYERGSKPSAASSGRAPTRTIRARRSSSTAGCGTEPAKRGRRRSRHRRRAEPVEALDDEFPLRLTTGRRLDSYNTGVQSARFASPLRRRRDDRDLAPEDASARRARRRGRARVSRRGACRRPRAHRRGPAARAGVHDLPLPRRGRHEPPDHRRHRSALGHRRVQGRGRPHREARAPPPPAGA